MVDIKAVKAVYEGSLKLTPEESCLIVTDPTKETIARAFYEYAKGITDRVSIEVMDPTKEHGQEPPERIAEAMLEYDVEMLITDKSLTHT
ncbi:MAG: aminopeptidase, partial [Candidatus Omnitrophota bacterium]